MADKSNYLLPVWAPRLRKAQIQRFYQRCGRGILDEELIDDVGFSLYSRCKSMLLVSQAMRGNPPCPSCEATAQVDEGANAFARCAKCGWVCPWALYQKTYQRKNLGAAGLEPFISEFVRRFPATSSYRQRVVLIDALIHRFHWESGGETNGRPGATSFIEALCLVHFCSRGPSGILPSRVIGLLRH